MKNENGCFLFLWLLISFWGGVILAFVEVKMLLGGLVGILITYIFWKIYINRRCFPNFNLLLIFGSLFATAVNVLIGIRIWISILSAVCIVGNFVGFLRIYSECKR